MSTKPTRRDVLANLGGLLGLALPAVLSGCTPLEHPIIARPANPFTLGVASGDPLPDGVVLWTRLAHDPLNGGGMPPQDLPVTWEIASDSRMRQVVRAGTALAQPQWGHSVHVEVSGLEPDRWYWYRFRFGGKASPLGRTRTAPKPDAHPDRLRFAFASCQNYERGYYTAWRHL